MKKVVIIGAGFAGISAGRILSKAHRGLEVTLIDRKSVADFLPMLPDCIGRGIHPDFLSIDLRKISHKFGINFLQDEVLSVNLEQKELKCASKSLNYDYLLIASGSETNFYANRNIEDNAFKVDSVEDVKRILEALKKQDKETFIVSGGGYTGVEVATNLRIFLERLGRGGTIIIVERAPAILGPLPQWMKDYVAQNLAWLNIEVLVNESIAMVEKDSVSLASGKILANAMLIWAAGVKTSGFIQNLTVDRNPQGRIKVDNNLRIKESCFIAGDAASFASGAAILRMAVQFAITQGECAAVNILRSVNGRPLKEFKPVDLGYVIPMANNRSCGTIFGMNFKGRFPTVLHFCMCLYRSYRWRNRVGIIKDLLSGGGK